MIGNDIVDLNVAAIASNWQRSRFLDKIFTGDEQELISNTNDSNKMVWLLWTMKESAYKVHVQEGSDRFFSPKKLRCSLTSSTSGVVWIKGRGYFTKSEFDSHYICTTAVLKNDAQVYNDLFKVEAPYYKVQQRTCYERISREVSKKLDLPIQKIRIRKNTLGIPKLYQNNKELKISFSLSHHGHYGVFSILN